MPSVGRPAQFGASARSDGVAILTYAASVEPYRLCSAGPKESETARTSAGSRRAPPLATMRSAARSALRTRSPRSTIRRSIVGTATRAPQRKRSRSARAVAASNRERNTSVPPSIRVSTATSSPQPWKTGADNSTRIPPRSGMRSSRPAVSSNVRGSARGAPFGTPLVPLVRMTSDAGCAGRGGREPSPRSTRRSSASAGASPPYRAHQRRPPNAVTAERNSSSWTSASRRSRAATTATCRGPKSAPSSTTRAPTAAAAHSVTSASA